MVKSFLKNVCTRYRLTVLMPLTPRFIMEVETYLFPLPVWYYSIKYIIWLIYYTTSYNLYNLCHQGRFSSTFEIISWMWVTISRVTDIRRLLLLYWNHYGANTQNTNTINKKQEREKKTSWHDINTMWSYVRSVRFLTDMC